VVYDGREKRTNKKQKEESAKRDTPTGEGKGEKESQERQNRKNVTSVKRGNAQHIERSTSELVFHCFVREQRERRN